MSSWPYCHRYESWDIFTFYGVSLETANKQRPQSPSQQLKLGKEEYDCLPQFPKILPLPVRRTIRRKEGHQIMHMDETVIYELEQQATCQAHWLLF